ncbi:hypothetical protein CDO44_00845 [Pigmentiphaga sp. NML080357]|nr:hypothetical protein CDO44_00845 [Pigmentiphaga sp. NML080357]
MIAGAALALLAACGGGDGSDSTPDASAAGFWNGSAGSDTLLAMLVAENGEVWGFYTDAGSDRAPQDYGLIHGTSSVRGTTLTAKGRDYRSNGQVAEGSLTAEVAEKKRLKGKIASGGEIGFAADYDSSYEQPAKLDDLKGDPWLLADNSGGSSVISVAADGSVTGSAAGLQGGTCALTGSVAPQPGRHYFNITIKFADSPECLLRNQAIQGVAIHELVNGQGLLVGALLTADKSRALIAVGMRRFT